jgi:hypothetical protein
MLVSTFPATTAGDRLGSAPAGGFNNPDGITKSIRDVIPPFIGKTPPIKHRITYNVAAVVIACGALKHRGCTPAVPVKSIVKRPSRGTNRTAIRVPSSSVSLKERGSFPSVSIHRPTASLA